MIYLVVLIGILVLVRLAIYLAGRPKKTVSSKQPPRPCPADRDERETRIWANIMTRDSLISVQCYLIDKLTKLEVTNWGDYALQAICTHSPSLSKLMVGRRLSIESIRESEKKGIEDAIQALSNTQINDTMTLRDYFHKIFENIIKQTRSGAGNKFYMFGRDRVIQMLRSYRASIKRFVPSESPLKNIHGEIFRLDGDIDTKTLQKVRDSLTLFEQHAEKHSALEKLKDQYRFEIKSAFPVIEFDLDAIRDSGNFIYEGALVNCLYLDLKQLLYVACDYSYIDSRHVTDRLYDAEAVSYTYENGIVILGKYKGSVEYFPDRLYVELQYIAFDSWIFRWLTSYKMHLEGND